VIAAAIGSIASQLNQSLKRTFRVGEDLVLVSNLSRSAGQEVTEAEDKLVLLLVNIERDPLPYQPAPLGHGAGGRIGLTNVPVHLNLMLMFAAAFSGTKYPEALKFISHTISFFQSRPVLDHQNTPELDPRIDKLVLDIENLSIADLSNLWSILGGAYLPSVLYRMRMVTLDAHQLTGQVPYVGRPHTDVHS
jgi:hypothetical protein